MQLYPGLHQTQLFARQVTDQNLTVSQIGSLTLRPVAVEPV